MNLKITIRKQHWVTISLVSLFCLCMTSFAEETSPVGRWKTIDDETGLEKSLVEIWQENQNLFGRVVVIYPNPGVDPDKICDLCPGDRKNQPVKGMTILTDMKKDGSEWSGGHILDPKNGKVYKCRLRLMDNGKKLDVRGYIGVSLIGRSQTWTRVIESDEKQTETDTSEP